MQLTGDTWARTRLDGSEARCVLMPARPVNTVVWYLHDVVQGVRDVENVDEARHWAVSTLWTALPIRARQRCHD